MKKLLALLFALLLATPAFGISVNGYLNRAALENEAIDPSTTLTGRVYWNTTQSTAKIYTGSAWIPLGSGGMSAAYTQAPTVAVTAVGGVNPGLGHVIDAKDFTAETSTQVTFYNLSANGNDGSTQGINLTANGTPTYTTTNILGTASAAATLNGTTQYYSSTNAFFNPGNGKSIAMGAWAYKSNWASATTEVILAQEQSGSDRGFALFYSSGTINFYGTNTASAYDTALTFTLPSSFASGWHHFSWVYNFSTTTLTGYVDDKPVVSGTLANQRAVTSAVFEIGAERGTPANFFSGAVEDAFFISGYAPTADDIRKLASRRLDHNLAIDPSAQLALATYERADGKLYLPGDTSWIVDKSSNSLWYDFSGSAVGSFVGFRLFNTGSTPNNVPLVSYDSGWLSAAPATTIAHGLGSIATNGNVCYVTGYGATGAAQCYPLSNYCSSDSTNLYCDWTGLSISSSNQVRLVAWLDGTQAAVTAASASTSGVVNTTSQTFAGDKKFLGGIGDVAYVGTDPEVGGTTPFQMVDGGHPIQVVNHAASNTVKLPTSGIKAGEIFEVHNRNLLDYVAIQSSSGAALETLGQGFARFIALVDAPTAAADWWEADVQDSNFFSCTMSATNWPTTTVNCYWARARNLVTMSVQGAVVNATSTMSTAITWDLSNMPNVIRPTLVINPVVWVYNNVQGAGSVSIPLSGNGFIFANNSSGSFGCTSGQSCGPNTFTISYRRN